MKLYLLTLSFLGVLALQQVARAQDISSNPHYCGLNRSGWRTGDQITTGMFRPLIVKIKKERRRLRKGDSRRQVNTARDSLRSMIIRERVETSACVSSPVATFPEAGIAAAPAGEFYPWQVFPYAAPGGAEVIPFFFQEEGVSVKLASSEYNDMEKKVTFWFDLSNAGKPTMTTVVKSSATMVNENGLQKIADAIVFPDGAEYRGQSVGFITPYNRPFRIGVRFDVTLFQESTTYVRLPLAVSGVFSKYLYFYNVPYTFNEGSSTSTTGEVEQGSTTEVDGGSTTTTQTSPATDIERKSKNYGSTIYQDSY
jgi:hypothetical protein